MKVRSLIVLVFFSFQLTALWGQTANQDSLLAIIDRMPADTTRLSFLYDLSKENGKRKDLYWEKVLLSEARKQKNPEYVAHAYFWIIRYYYSYNMDSMKYYLDLSEPVFKQAKKYDYLFRTKAWYGYLLTNASLNDEALTWIKSVEELADQLAYPDGKDMAKQALANFYIRNRLYEEGEDLYNEILLGMEDRGVPLVKQMYIIQQLFTVSKSSKSRLKYLSVYKKRLDECKAKGIEKLDDENPICMLEYLYYRSYAHESLSLYQSEGEGDLADIYKNLRKASEILEVNKLERRRIELDNVYAYYYREAKEYDKAITVYTSLINEYRRQGRETAVGNMLEYRGGVAFEAGRFREAAIDFMGLASLRDSIQQTSFYKELADMRAQHETDKLELRNQKMEMETMRARNMLAFMSIGVLLLILICGLLVYWGYQKHKLGEQFKLAKEKAEEADRIKSAFLANMNHEIRTPLNAIVGFSQVLVEEEDKEIRQEFANIIQNNNELLQRLVTDVLDLSKIDSNTMPLIYKQQDIPILMKEIHSTILLRMRDGIDLQLTDCEALVMDTDRNRLTQILTNLLTNAIKHTQEGFIRFGYRRIDESVEFFVQDSGEGIPEEQLERVFSRFVQLDHWSKGVGLGLAICKGLIGQMGGSIRVTSKVGEGSIFYVTLPQIRPNAGS